MSIFDSCTSCMQPSSSSTIAPFYRFLLLTILCIQTAAGGLLINYSNVIKDNKYSNMELVMMCEVVKFILSSIITLSSVDENGNRKNIMWIYKVVTGGVKVVPLVLMYSCSNILVIYSITRIGAASFSVCIN